MRLEFSLPLLLSLFSSSAAAASIEQNLQECLGDGQFEIGVDYFPHKYTPTEYRPIFLPSDEAYLDTTTDFLKIEYFDYYKIITNSWHNKTYLLYQCGTVPPQDEVDSGRHHLILPVPHNGGLAITETPQIPPIELLGLREQIIAYIGDPQYVSSPCLNYLMDVDGSVETVFDPDDPWNTTKSDDLTAEFLERNPGAVIFGGIYSNSDGNRVIGVAESQERTNVATFDWIALYAALFNMEALSNEIAMQTKERYICSSSNAMTLSADIPAEARPVVLWADYFDGYNWSVAECPTWDYTYYCEYARSCGVDIISRPEGLGWNDQSYGGDYWYLDDQQLLDIGKDADIWIYPSDTWDAVYEQKKAILDQFKAVQNKQVFDTQGGGNSAWYEQRLAEYDVVGNDFCALVGTSNPQQIPPHTIKWFRNVYTGNIPEPGTCDVPDELDERYVPVGAFCSPLVPEDGNNGGTEPAVSPDGSGVTSLAPLEYFMVATLPLVMASMW
jgi:hypothetical protein